MKNKGRRYKRAKDALKKSVLDKYEYTKGHVISVSKTHPNYFTAMVYDSLKDEWQIHLCAYLSAYMNPDGSFVKTR